MSHHAATHHHHGDHHGPRRPQQRHHYVPPRVSLRVEVRLNGDPGIVDHFRLSFNATWNSFYERVTATLCPELTPEYTDCIRDERGAQVFETEVLNDGEVLYFCPRGEKLRHLEQQHQQRAALHGHHSLAMSYGVGLAPPAPQQYDPVGASIVAAAQQGAGQFENFATLDQGLGLVPPSAAAVHFYSQPQHEGGGGIDPDTPETEYRTISFPGPDGTTPPPQEQETTDKPAEGDTIDFPTPEQSKIDLCASTDKHEKDGVKEKQKEQNEETKDKESKTTTAEQKEAEAKHAEAASSAV